MPSPAPSASRSGATTAIGLFVLHSATLAVAESGATGPPCLRCQGRSVVTERRARRGHGDALVRRRMVEAGKQFRRVNGHLHLASLRAARP